MLLRRILMSAVLVCATSGFAEEKEKKFRILDRAGKVVDASDDYTLISKKLFSVGIELKHVPVGNLNSKSTDKEILDQFADVIEAYKKPEHGYQHIDIVRVTPQHPQKEELRKKFFPEHTHKEAELRLLVEGSGMYYLPQKDGSIFVFRIEGGDLLGIPADCKHGFDTGKEPAFTAIRFFKQKNGWEANYTGSGVEGQFPRYE